MKRRLLEYLACPACGGEIKLSSVLSDDGGEIFSGELQCASCSKTFPIERGVPRFADLDTVEAEKQATAESFGWSWQQFTQEDARYEQQFLIGSRRCNPNSFPESWCLRAVVVRAATLDAWLSGVRKTSSRLI